MDEEEALSKICGGDSMSAKAQELWDEMLNKGRLDISKGRYNDEEVTNLLKGLHM